MKKEIRDILERGCRYEWDHNEGKCIRQFPAYETNIMVNFYDFRVENGQSISDLDEFIMEDLARTWTKYFELGHEKYWEEYFKDRKIRSGCKTIYPEKGN